MTLFQNIYNAIKKFFDFLSCRTTSEYVSLNSDDNEEVNKIYNNMI